MEPARWVFPSNAKLIPIPLTAGRDSAWRHSLRHSKRKRMLGSWNIDTETFKAESFYFKFVKGKREDGNDAIKELKWETLENRRRKTRITSLYRAHLGQKAWVDITARLEKSTYYGRNDHDFKIKCRKQKTDEDSQLDMMAPFKRFGEANISEIEFQSTTAHKSGRDKMTNQLTAGRVGHRKQVKKLVKKKLARRPETTKRGSKEDLGSPSTCEGKEGNKEPQKYSLRSWCLRGVE
ncbi:hypothetical protein ANN_27239 [Periplaneta americana]|uniref:Uncharacterized protein n=1 Tax=Periplaneta americana TaxID=6978 RepID=A0ABQ8RXR3_PERAM|nr:hypothetical protein ANN_27239 [Periplaneta americana]